MDDADTAPREHCLRCRRPASHCYCGHLPALATRTRVVFLQHPRESDVAIGTCRMAHLSLPGSTLIDGTRLDGHPVVERLCQEDGVAVLFPGEQARPLEDWLATRPPTTLVVLDGTWWQAQKLLKLNPKLASLPRLSFHPTTPGNYRIRKEPTDQHLATIEAVAAVLGALEGDVPRFQALLQPFDYMVERQLDAARSRVGRHRHAKAFRTSPLFELTPLVEAPRRAVILYAEANCSPREERVPGAPEALHIVAARPALLPSTDARFEAVLAPRRSLGTTTPGRIGLTADDLAHGETPEAALARFRAFWDAERDAQLVAWGPYPRDLLTAEGEPRRGFIDLRALAARALGRSPGGIDRCAADLGVDVKPALRGRAGRMLALLEGIYAALCDRAAVAPVEIA